MSIKKVIEAIKGNKRFLISSHVNLEGDALGSLIALHNLLKKLGKKVMIVCDDKPPRMYKFLFRNIKIYTERPHGSSYDVAIIVDCPEVSRIGRAEKSLIETKPIVNIDHHVSNRYFGKVNLVEPEACSAGEIIFGLFEKMKVDVDRQSAICLYTAIFTDTGSFRYENTTPKCLHVAGELLKHGIKPQKLSEMIYETSKFPEIKLLGLTLSGMQHSKDGKIAWIKTTRKMMESVGARKSITERFINFPRSIEGVKVAIFFKEIGKTGYVKVSFRSKASVDVNKIARLFGGGGHRAASGCEIKGPISKAEKMVLDEVKKAVENKINNRNKIKW